MKFSVTIACLRHQILLLPLCFCFLIAHTQRPRDPHFKKHILSSDFVSEGVAVADINNDGKPDITAGAYWFEAPTWTKHEIAKGRFLSPVTEYSNSFLNFCLDVNLDGWMDVIRIGLPGEEAVWYQNPQNKPGLWPMHFIAKNAGNESPLMVDIDKDGRLDLLCNDPVLKQITWLKSPVQKGDTSWTRYIIDQGSIAGIGKYTHGFGFADVNGDGKSDVIITKGWWESPSDPKQANWTFHPTDFGEDCAQIYAMNIKGNGLNELVSSSAHKFGIWWHEKNSDGTWAHHTIFNEFSQTHALALADINKDGQPDLVTGKRYMAHNGGDPGAFQSSVLYWFEFKPGTNPKWIPHLIDSNSGVGLQVCTDDINQDGWPDIVVGNKKGVFFFEQIPR